MAFKIVKDLIVKWRVDVTQPVDQVDDRNKVEKSDFTAHFKILKDTEYTDFAKELKDDRDLIAKFLVGWDGLVDEDDKPIEFTDDNLKAITSYTFVRTAIFKAYGAAASGIGDPEIKN